MPSLGAQLALIVSGLLAVLYAEIQAPLALLPWWSALPLLALPPLARSAAHRAAMQRFRGRTWWFASRAATLGLFLSPLLVELAFLFLTNFAAFARAHTPWDSIPGWLGLEALVLLAPLAVAQLVIAGKPGARLFPSLFERDNLRARLALFAWSVLGLYLALATLIARSATLRIWVEESTPAALAFSLATLVVLLFLVPRLLLALLDTLPIEGYARQVAEQVASQLQVRPPNLREWRTDDEISNAMVLAMPFGPRPVLFTDAFLAQLSIGEFRAVLAHELGHVAGRHVGIFVGFVLGTALTFEALFAVPLQGPWGEVLALAFLVGLGLAIGFLSRRLELEADLFALETTGEMRGLERALTRVGGGHMARKSWRHFSVVRRLIFLRAHQSDAGVGRRLRVGIAGARRLSVGLLLVGFLATTWSAVQRAPGEHFWIDLRRGQLSAASARLATLGPEDFARIGDLEFRDSEARADLERLVRLGVELEGAGAVLTTDALGVWAAAAMEADNASRARAIFDLALLLAGPEAQRLARALAGEPLEERLSPAWSETVLALRRSP